MSTHFRGPWLAGSALLVVACSAGGRPDASGWEPPETGGAGGQAGTTGGTPAVAAGGSGGALPTAPTATPTATGGSPPFAGYDPAVSFDWPEAVATSGACKAGHYHGSFIGIYSPGITVFPAPIPVAGDIDLTLTESANGETFEVTGGKVSGVADGLFPFSADVAGTLDCTTGKLENGFLSSGVYLVGVLPGYFEGPLEADYDTLTQSFVNATWKVQEPKVTTPPSIYGGSGTWQASWVGP